MKEKTRISLTYLWLVPLCSGLAYYGVNPFVLNSTKFIGLFFGLFNQMEMPHKFYALVLLIWLGFYIGIAFINLALNIWNKFKPKQSNLNKESGEWKKLAIFFLNET